MNYQFSPIQNETDLKKAVVYVAEHSSQMCERIIGKTLPIHTLTIFAHTDVEFDQLKSILATMGTPYNENNGPRVSLHESIAVGNNAITHLRIRHPDLERPQVGCNDFDVEHYETFKSEYLEKYPKGLVLIKRPEYEMIEFHHPDFDVLAYIVSKKD
ncbi:MAG: hypothetical protein E6P95_03725 [Candidatus Moraniibacteriota bacterium]|nr:MAG: hypothetical protein E6P95_03725 [Candidatus Moranbacteria bacterium]